MKIVILKNKYLVVDLYRSHLIKTIAGLVVSVIFFTLTTQVHISFASNSLVAFILNIFNTLLHEQQMLKYISIIN